MSADSLFRALGLGLALLLLPGLSSGCRDDGTDTAAHSGTAGGELPEDTSRTWSLTIQQEPWGETPDGKGIDRFLLTNTSGMTVSVINYGAIVTSIEVPDRDGKIADVTLGFDNLDGYLGEDPYFGAICGRYANRIAEGKFDLNGEQYQLATNNGPNHLHGGTVGFNERVWTARMLPPADAGARSVGVELEYLSPDGEEEYPGSLLVKVTYTLTNDNELKIDYQATNTGEKDTILNLTNHCYWNLSGNAKRDVLGHELSMQCDRWLPVDETLIPTGEIREVSGTPMDFTQPTTIGSRIKQVKGDNPQGGYDHCYVVNETDEQPAPAAVVHDPESGRVMEVFTTEPGMQLYTGNFLEGSEANGGFAQHFGFCLECQHFPDSPNHPEFPSTVLEKGAVYTQTTIHRFSVRK